MVVLPSLKLGETWPKGCHLSRSNRYRNRKTAVESSGLVENRIMENSDGGEDVQLSIATFDKMATGRELNIL